ncbi:hypothetical protein [Chitinophaga sp. sic0106]|uniref:hypothetical protein n=1 Tax=Chitinophaga sp. sic0106 TaxID=2854785 RepID=UPI001C48BC66|nr:hypothetical protein [Chitinophaga sp. sic0106]MBV7529020.1 hypothetical protein [Chitinophaga sp. sic0106]
MESYNLIKIEKTPGMIIQVTPVLEKRVHFLAFVESKDDNKVLILPITAAEIFNGEVVLPQKDSPRWLDIHAIKYNGDAYDCIDSMIDSCNAESGNCQVNVA